MAIRNYRAGWAVTDTPSDLRFMSANVGTTNHFMTFEFPVNTDYQVPSGKTLYITNIKASSPSTGSTFTLGYGDTGVASGASAPTNPVTLTFKFYESVSATEYNWDVFIPVPALKYPFLNSDANGHFVKIQGIEV